MEYFTQFKDGSQGFGKIHIGLIADQWIPFCGYVNKWEHQFPTDIEVVERSGWDIKNNVPSRLRINNLLMKGGGRRIADDYFRDCFCAKCLKALSKFKPEIFTDI
jgi:hypothetical protein